MELRIKTINELADMICGNVEYFKYRSSTYISEFFDDCGFDEYVHDGSTRKWWVADTLKEILARSSRSNDHASNEFITIIKALMDKADATEDNVDRDSALKKLNISLARDNLYAFYDTYGVCQLQSTTIYKDSANTVLPQRAWTADELKLRNELAQYMDAASEDDIIEKILLPLFQHLGFQRITTAGHKDRSLEYGKDIWMKYRLPTTHYLYFGIQVKKGKVDSAGRSRNTNVAEILNQIRMMLGHTIFDPETNKESLVDHAIIVAGGEITKQAKNWLGHNLHASQRSQILFMDRDDILDLMLAHNLHIPESVYSSFLRQQ